MKRYAVKGFIEVDEGHEFPEKENRVELMGVIVEVTGHHDDIQKRRGETTERVVTCKTNLLDASIGAVLPSLGHDPNQTSLDDAPRKLRSAE